MDWSDQTDEVIDGCGRFLDRLWRTALAEHEFRDGPQADTDRAVRQAVHRTIADVTRDIERWSYNTAVAHCMELLNLVQRYGRRDTTDGTDATAGSAGESGGRHADVWNEAIDTLLLLLAVMVPHVTAELWERRHPGEPSVHQQRWPTFDPDLVRQETVTMVVQVNGKVRDRIEVDAGISESDAEAAALASPKVTDALDGGAPTRVVVRPPRLVNVVV